MLIGSQSIMDITSSSLNVSINSQAGITTFKTTQLDLMGFY